MNSLAGLGSSRVLVGELAEHPVPFGPGPGGDCAEWIDRWLAMQDSGISTVETREYLIRRFIRPSGAESELGSLSTEDITRWENAIAARAGVSRRTTTWHASNVRLKREDRPHRNVKTSRVQLRGFDSLTPSMRKIHRCSCCQ
jgi:hypothetical protein